VSPVVRWMVAMVGLALIACAPRPPVTPVDPRERLVLDDEEAAALDPELAARLASDAHEYFRYVSNRFVGLECELAAEGPIVNLHGDAHLEQYLVTSLGRGMGDFDEATTGPASIDLLRLAASIRIVSRARDFDADALWRQFLEGYLTALRDPEVRAPEPALVARVRAAFTRDHAALLSFAESLLRPVPEREAARVEVAFADYVEMLARHRPELDARELEILEVGTHGLGVGSRRASNYLIRARGPTDAPGDDLVLEAKEVTRNPLASCLPIAQGDHPLRVLVADARLAYSPFRDVGLVRIDGRPYWVHEWVDDYVELDVHDPRTSEDDLREVLYDIGVQLGVGHPRALNDPYAGELRQELLTFVGSRGGALWTLADRLARLTWAAWEGFLARRVSGSR